MTTITELWRFPVKSMQGERIETAAMAEIGLEGDRAFAVLDKAEGHIASAKHPRKWGQLLNFAARLVDGGQVEISLPDGGAVRSDDAGVDAALSAALGRNVTLARTAPGDRHFEAVYPDIEGVLPDEFVADNKTGDEPEGQRVDIALGLAAPPGTFFDLTVLHVMTTATLAAVGADVRRFRPNIVIDAGGSGYPENEWVGRTLSFGDTLAATVLMPSMRCIMTTLPQPALDRDRGVLQTIARDNRIEIPGLGTWACAGVYCTIAGAGEIAVGGAVELS